MNKVLLIIILLVLFGGGFYLINQRHNTTGTTNQLQVYTSFYPLYFFATQIAGDKASIHNITPAAAEPHDYDPTAQDIANIEKGNMLILNGGVEAWGDKIKNNLKGTNVEVITAGDGLITKQLTENGQTQPDPHVWLNPVLAKEEAAKITQGFIKVDPTNAATYQQNEKQLDAKLDQVDAEYKKGLASCQSHDIITSHAAFAYLGQRYGLHQVAIAGLSPDAEPSAQQLADVSNFAKQNHVQYIFFESLVSPKLSDTIAQEVGAKTLVLDPLEGIPQDEMSKGANYFTIMNQNLHNLQTALQCTQ